VGEKVELVECYGAEFGMNRTLEALQLSKGTWHYRSRVHRPYSERYEALRAPLLEVARKHPSYGYRKVTSELRDHGWTVNRKVVQKLQKAWELPLIRVVRPPRPSAIRQALRQMGDRINLVVALETIGILDVFYTDFTELEFDRGSQKAQLMPILDHTSKLVVGWAVGHSANAEVALEAYARARRTLLRYGISLQGVVMHHDQDPAYTSHAWIEALRLRDRVRLSYSLNGAQGNTHLESFNGHFKEENASIFWEQKNFDGVRRVVQGRMVYYNDIRRHASLGNIALVAFLKKHGFEVR
jgi:putative transposase